MTNLTVTERNQLRRLLLQAFDKDEIKGFYFELALTVDHLEASSREKLAADLIQHLDNQARLTELIPLILELRPQLKTAFTRTAYPSLAVLPNANTQPLNLPLAMPTVQVLVCYSQRDQAWQARLAQHLHRLIAPQHIVYQDDQTDFIQHDHHTLHTALTTAKVAVLLVSTHFLSSDFIQMEQVPKLLALQANTQLKLYPIILKPCTWQLLDWLNQLPIHPTPERVLSSGTASQIETDLAQMAQEIAYY